MQKIIPWALGVGLMFIFTAASDPGLSHPVQKLRSEKASLTNDRFTHVDNWWRGWRWHRWWRWYR